jgi:hypothetical protein
MNIKNNKTSIKDKPEFRCFNKHWRIPKGNQNLLSRKTGNIGYTKRRQTKQKTTPQYVFPCADYVGLLICI